MSCISKLQLYLKHKKYTLTFADIADFLYSTNALVIQGVDKG